jgi:hypothetical protein
MSNEPSSESRWARALFGAAEPMSNGRYIFFLFVFVLSVLVLVLALFAGPHWWLASSAVLTGTGCGAQAFRERQRRMRERTNRRRVASAD